jgi:hypothetical protein
VAVAGTVERLEKSTEGGLVTWRFVLRRPDGSAVVVELQGEEVHGTLRDGDEVELPHADLTPDVDLVSPRSLDNKTVGVGVSVRRRGSARRLGSHLGTTAATTAVSSVAAAAVTLVLSAGGSGDAAPAPGGGGGGADESAMSTGALIILSIVEFLVLWLIWFVIWGRRWRRPARVWATAGIAVGALIAFVIGSAVS